MVTNIATIFDPSLNSPEIPCHWCPRLRMGCKAVITTHSKCRRLLVGDGIRIWYQHKRSNRSKQSSFVFSWCPQQHKARYFSWCNQGGRSVTLNRAIKELFFLFATVKLNILLQLSFIPTNETRQTLLQEGYRLSIVCSAQDCGGESSLNLGAPGTIPVLWWPWTKTQWKVSMGGPFLIFYPSAFPRILRGKCTCTKPIISWLTLCLSSLALVGPVFTSSGKLSQILHNGSFRHIPKKILVTTDPKVLYKVLQTSP